MMISDLKDVLLPITSFRKNMSKIIETLVEPKVLMKNDEPKAVILPYELYRHFEKALDDQLDLALVSVAAERLANDQFLPADDFFDKVMNDESV
ncbi:MAG: type II toxin-antitoxin system Phd/YefM family antitoxin [Bacillota bacterium]|nr:type II toxin-antitoxin system Phd/YefM family antitoxin [Bacillota bacterium]